MKPRICEATGKRIYKRRQDAHKDIGSSSKRALGLVRKPLTAYQCTACGKWHLTSFTPEQSRVVRAGQARGRG